MDCSRCNTTLVPDSANTETDYQFDNALWIGFYGGYGMFVDNLEAKMPHNTDERWLRQSDHRDEWGMYDDFVTIQKPDGSLHPVEDPEWEPRFHEERTVPGHPDYEAVLCHDCAHELCEAEPWLHELIKPHGSHAHRQEYIDTHPDHWGWDIDRN